MKIYFAGSIRGGRQNQENYFKIIKHLQEYGEVLTKHIGGKDLSDFGEEDISDQEIYKRDISWLKESDVVVAEISTPSLGMGYEIAKAEEFGKKVICLYEKPEKGKRISAMMAGNKNIILKEYNDLEDLIHVIKKTFKK